MFRGQCIVGYWLTEQVYQTRPYGEKRPWDYLNTDATSENGIGKFKKDFATGALAHPDGFPIHVFFNGKDAGIYALNLKKHRDNYYAEKDNPNNIILDGLIDAGTLFGGTVDWTQFEIRNPKSLVTINNGKYDGDNPSEITGDEEVDKVTADTRKNIERLAKAAAELSSNKTKETFEKYFIVEPFIDYFLISNVIHNADGFRKNWIWCTWDGNRWTPTSYDMDSIFGMLANGTGIVPDGEWVTDPYQDVAFWSNSNMLLGTGRYNAGIIRPMWDLYKDEIRKRYKELRDNGVFTTENILNLLNKWLDKVGYDNLKGDIEGVCAYNDVPQTPSYRDGNGSYALLPNTGGFFNSPMRVKKWLDNHFEYLDSETIFNYNNN